MKIVLLNGSPRSDGNTQSMLNELEAHMLNYSADNTDIKIVQVSQLLEELDTPYCTACSNPCQGNCYEDTRLEKLITSLSEVDGLVAASPVYFGTVSAQLKSFWDLTRTVRGNESLLYTVGAAIAVGGGRFGGQETTLRAIHDMMFIHGMLLVGDSCTGNMGHQGPVAQQPFEKDDNAKTRLEVLAQSVVETAAATRRLRSKK